MEMTRAEMRRSKREQEKAQTATYNFTQAQLDALIQEKIGAKLEQSKQEIYEQTVNTTLALLLGLPMKVLIDDYWKKSYRQRIPGFVDKVLEYYDQWQDGKLDISKLNKELWDIAGIRLEGISVEE
jgi:hypothetical protein